MAHTAREARERFAANVEVLRRRAGLSQDELASRSGVDGADLQRILSGEMEVGAGATSMIAGALGVGPGDLFRGITWIPPAEGRPGRYEVEGPDGG
jgi:transcriptional regulator with XRE-family HTH domain